jgi:hypothetical protein
MELKKILKRLKEESFFELLKYGWEKSEKSFLEPQPFFLKPENVDIYRKHAQMPRETEPVFHKTLNIIINHPELLHLAWHCYRLAFEDLEYPDEKIKQWPPLKKSLGELSAMFYLLVGLAADEKARISYGKKVPEKVIADTFRSVVTLRAEIYYKENKKWGIQPKALTWIRNYAKGNLYRLGRLTYKKGPFRGALNVYRNTDKNIVIALAEDGLCFSSEGYFDNDGGISDTNRWKSYLKRGTDTIKGNPIMPRGVAVKHQVEIPADKWKPVLLPGQPIIEIHIPGGESMDIRACIASLQEASEFFPRYFPDYPFKAFVCHSWLLNNQFQEFLSPESNIIKFQKEGYLYPLPTPDGKAGIDRIFGKSDIDPLTAPRDTSLRSGVVDILRGGNPLRSGGMFILKEDTAQLGTKKYISMDEKAINTILSGN